MFSICQQYFYLRFIRNHVCSLCIQTLNVLPSLNNDTQSLQWTLWGILWWLNLGRYRGNQMSVEYILHLCFPCNMNQLALIWGSKPLPCLVTHVWCVRGGSCFLWKDDFLPLIRCPISFGLLFQSKISQDPRALYCAGDCIPHVLMFPCYSTLCFADTMYLHVCVGIAWALEQCAFLL